MSDSRMSETIVNRTLRLLAMLALASAFAGCDKCGHPVKFNAPTIQKACDGDAGSGR